MLTTFDMTRADSAMAAPLLLRELLRFRAAQEVAPQPPHLHVGAGLLQQQQQYQGAHQGEGTCVWCRLIHIVCKVLTMCATIDVPCISITIGSPLRLGQQPPLYHTSASMISVTSQCTGVMITGSLAQLPRHT
jgi:hypothetical protein